jgi:hypothetical protein
MSTVDQRQTLAELLEDAAKGKLSPDAALDKVNSWKDFPWRERAFDAAWHSLCHFQSDEDIRGKDSQYAASQRIGLLSLAQYLRAEEYDENRLLPGTISSIAMSLGAVVLLIVLLWYLL